MTMEAYKFSVRTYDVDAPMHLNSLNQTLSARNESYHRHYDRKTLGMIGPPLKTHRGYKTVQNNS